MGSLSSYVQLGFAVGYTPLWNMEWRGRGIPIAAVKLF